MDIQVLVATMNQKDFELVKKMNIKSNAIIGNQCDRNSVEEFVLNNNNNNNIKYLNFKEKGVGLNRNNALMRADAEICLIADDDMRYLDGYEEIVKKTFRKYEDADIVIFNIKEKEPTRYVNKKAYRVRWYNYMRFGAVRIAFRTESIKSNAITFNLLFGGGAKYSHGEDTLFLTDCLKRGLKIIAVPEYIAELEDSRESTWFNRI